MIKAILYLPFEAFNLLLMKLFCGLPEPGLQSWAVIKHKWKIFRGRRILSQELDCVNGYLYWKLTYNDGSTNLFR